MKLANTFHPSHRLVQTELEASHNFNDSLKVIDGAIQSCGQTPYSGILIDLTACQHSISFSEVCRVANRIAQANKVHPNRYAFIVGDEAKLIEVAQLLEFCLTQDGILTQYFFDVETASRWLEYGFDSISRLSIIGA